VISRFFKVRSPSSSTLSPGSARFSVLLTFLTLLICGILPSEMPGFNEKSLTSQIVINEIMKNPVSVSDSHGEYIELFNPNSYQVNINNWAIMDLGGDYHMIESEDTLVIEPLSYFVLARDTSSATNGGFPADYEYSSFTLSNGADEVILVNGAGVVVDSTGYDSSDFPVEAGCAMELRNQLFDNTHGYNWKDSMNSFGLGDNGTPGSVNSVWEEYKDMTLDTDEDTLSVVPGATAQITFYVTDQSDGVVDALLEGDLYLPDGNPFPGNPFLGPAILSFDSGERMEKTLHIYVPDWAETGSYLLVGRLLGAAESEMDREEVCIEVVTDTNDEERANLISDMKRFEGE